MGHEWMVTVLLSDELLGGPKAEQVLEITLPTKSLAERIYAALGDHYAVKEGPHIWNRKTRGGKPTSDWKLTEPTYTWELRQRTVTG